MDPTESLKKHVNVKCKPPSTMFEPQKKICRISAENFVVGLIILMKQPLNTCGNGAAQVQKKSLFFLYRVVSVCLKLSVDFIKRTITISVLYALNS